LENSANIPNINDNLIIALPNTVDIAISGYPVMVEYVLTTRSGKDVPNAINVNPIRKLPIFIFFANAMDCSTKISADLIRMSNESIASRIGGILF